MSFGGWGDFGGWVSFGVWGEFWGVIINYGRGVPIFVGGHENIGPLDGGP